MSSSDSSGREESQPAPPWWAEGGSELCPFCEQLYVYEVEIRCVDCDSPSCPHCAVVERLTRITHRCPDCGEDEG